MTMDDVRRPLFEEAEALTRAETKLAKIRELCDVARRRREGSFAAGNVGRPETVWLAESKVRRILDEDQP